MRLDICCAFFLNQIQSSEGITITKDGTFHRLKIHKVTEEFAGTYKFEADGRKTEAQIIVEGKTPSSQNIVPRIQGTEYCIYCNSNDYSTCLISMALLKTSLCFYQRF